MTRELFLLTRGSDPRIRLADPKLETLIALVPKGFSRTNTELFSFGIIFKHYENTAKSLYALPASIRTHYSQATYRCGAQT